MNHEFSLYHNVLKIFFKTKNELEFLVCKTSRHHNQTQFVTRTAAEATVFSAVDLGPVFILFANVVSVSRTVF